MLETLWHASCKLHPKKQYYLYRHWIGSNFRFGVGWCKRCTI